MKAVILGATGYTGMVLMRILADHPQIDSIVPVSHSKAGTPVVDVDPGLGPAIAAKLTACGGRLVAIDDAAPDAADVVFSALPHGASADIAGPLAGRVPIIDLSADFRLADPSLYQTVYGAPHPHPDLLSRSVYGLTEWYRRDIATADIIANPGCYPTATLLPLLPFVDVVRFPVIVNALSGISGAGRKETRDLLFNERSENMNAYNPGRTHRHVPEIEQALSCRAGAPQTVSLVFTPHLVPIKQGMIVTTVAELSRPMSQQEASDRIAAAYAEEPFVRVSARGTPESRDVRSTNRCDIGVKVLESDGRLMLFSAIDNLYKGAAGQAVQNMNARLGIPETAGLRIHGEF